MCKAILVVTYMFIDILEPKVVYFPIKDQKHYSKLLNRIADEDYKKEAESRGIIKMRKEATLYSEKPFYCGDEH